MTFYKWLCGQKDRSDEVGEIAQDAYQNDNRPKNAKSEDYRYWCKFASRRKSTKKARKQAINKLDRAWYEYMLDYRRSIIHD